MTGKEFRRLRRGRLDITQPQLAEILHISVRTVSEYENRGDAQVPRTVELAIKCLCEAKHA